MPEWLRGWTANPLGIALAGSNPAVFVMIINNNFLIIFSLLILYKCFLIHSDMAVKIL